MTSLKSYSDLLILVPILVYHEEGNPKIVDEVAPIRAVAKEDANQAFFSVNPGEMVYHTSNENFIINIRREPL
ncbi:hypothetical protein F3157_14120 [Virgibacillus dakarensis]|uniref:Uncharacterized protein n=1 Tax=Lentibacillus populi TaxID=1827502 RepID=A0A9W5X4V3_9BACI|nr:MULTISPECIES: hypothetical protein [Bacillaceae]MTW86788.1 hypothetical protein [Virgibacillus dakarensis]GGB38362.1 hypothetical protein GCM10011409_14830 [Lentibacillus populi]